MAGACSRRLESPHKSNSAGVTSALPFEISHDFQEENYEYAIIQSKERGKVFLA